MDNTAKTAAELKAELAKKEARLPPQRTRRSAHGRRLPPSWTKVPLSKSALMSSATLTSGTTKA